MYEAQIEVLNRNNTGSSFSVNPRLLCVWLLPTGIAEEVHVNSMADLTAAQPWRVRSWMLLSRSNDIFLCLVTYLFAEYEGGPREPVSHPSAGVGMGTSCSAVVALPPTPLWLGASAVTTEAWRVAAVFIGDLVLSLWQNP